ncbi:MAG: hypothetical protein PUP92_03490 [Rhizonema sp. PD38]|nr:hypothetical protein [Rhizonema sp. PD38]
MLNKSTAFGLLAFGLISQSQHLAQGTSQNSAATDGSTTAQSSSIVNTQTQYSRTGSGC